ncbi:MAG: hypothetical protein ACLP7Q_20860 [Isosphaeraceae bacterium]
MGQAFCLLLIGFVLLPTWSMAVEDEAVRSSPETEQGVARSRPLPDEGLRRAQATPLPPPVAPSPPSPPPTRRPELSGPFPAPPSGVAPSPPPPISPPTPLAVALAPATAGGPGTFAGTMAEGLTDLGSFAGGGVPLMLGDLAPLFGTPNLHRLDPPASAVRFPWVRGYKMADNQSPRPQDRVFIAFNYFDNLLQSPTTGLRDVQVYREFFGLEKTFFDQRASVGLRMPLNSISAKGTMPGLGGSSTAVGDLTVFFKGIVCQDRKSGNLLSAGLAVTTPNSPSGFAGAHFAQSIRTTSLQPFVGYIANFGDWFVQGFSGTNVPTDGRVVTMYYNDVGVGYFLYRAADPEALIGAIVPTMEVHVNTPLNHRVSHAVGAAPGTPDVVDLTFGASVALGRRAILSAGVVDPVTGPRPYDLEVVALLNIFYGRRLTPPTPPPAF